MTRQIRFSRSQLVARRSAPRPAARTSEPTMSLDEALEVLRGASGAVREITNRRRAATSDHHQQLEAEASNLTGRGREARLRELAEQANAQTAQASAQLRARIEAAHAALTARAERARPNPAAGVEGIMGRQVRWNRVREMLDGGVALDEVVAEADTETLHALRDEVGAYLQVRGFNTERRAEVLRAVDDQLAHVAGGRALEVHQAAREAEVYVAEAGPLLADIDAVGAGRMEAGSGLGYAIQAMLARQQTAAQLGQLGPVDDDPAEVPEAGSGLGSAIAADLARQQDEPAEVPAGDAA